MINSIPCLRQKSRKTYPGWPTSPLSPFKGVPPPPGTKLNKLYDRTIHFVEGYSRSLLTGQFTMSSVECRNIKEIKHDVYGRRQMAKVNSDFLFFSCNPYINHTKTKRCLLLFTANNNILILLHRELKTDGKSFIFAVCRKRHA